MGKLLILGAGGHGKVVAECALSLGIYTTIAFLDDDEKVIEESILGSCPVIGTFSDAGSFVHKFSEAFVALGNNRSRVRLITYLREIGYKIPCLIHPAAYVSKSAHIEIGTVIMAGAVVNADAHIGVGGIINTGASVDHDCVLGVGVHLSPGARLGGTVTVGDYTWICMGANVVNNVHVGKGSVAAAGATVIRDVGDNLLVAKVPARELKKTDLKR
ncbi:acetyltransferase [Desulfosporosinus youngiae]|uniref:Sugar O-acyltransferase, sialic acid O-acetyltransferase NeuD family n=1 Tax=Desulfosporosinus youngiae DSM 17734 TaxID=768710 RepID=H5XUD3_9FIRM|nr:acetyltransferase [Desulfosporosinus youngiae]EHQ89369.1 sugar O-acyltransferase, sialic acid O-acetyltransferase NeuD family [Desulfosporosinus youngiae DSM 17734]